MEVRGGGGVGVGKVKYAAKLEQGVGNTLNSPLFFSETWEEYRT